MILLAPVRVPDHDVPGWAENLKNAAAVDRGSDRGRRAVGEPLARGVREGARLVSVTLS